MLGKKVFEIADLAFPIALWQDGSDSFSVVYGADERCFLPYAQVAYQLGICILHALTCDGKLDGTEEE